jgi:hypothetical protein
MKSGEVFSPGLFFTTRRVSPFDLSCSMQSNTTSQSSLIRATTFMKRDTPQEEDGYAKE